jgi:hypothetical protein
MRLQVTGHILGAIRPAMVQTYDPRQKVDDERLLFADEWPFKLPFG